MSTTCFDTKTNWDDCHFDQYPGHKIHLSGQTVICGNLKICNSTGFTASYGAGLGKVLTSDAVGTATWQDAKSLSITKQICQSSHGFNVKDVVGWNALGCYTKAIADGTYNGEVLGLISKCYNADCFDLTQGGYVSGLTGLVASCTYFLSDVTPGLLSTTETTTVGHVDKSVLVATSTTDGWVLPYPGYYITSGGTGGITGATNLGSGNGTIYANTSVSKLNLKTLSGGTNVTLTCNGNYITINATGGGATPISGIFNWSGNTFNPYGVQTSGKFYSGATVPTNIIRLNYDGYITASNLKAFSSYVSLGAGAGCGTNSVVIGCGAGTSNCVNTVTIGCGATGGASSTVIGFCAGGTPLLTFGQTAVGYQAGMFAQQSNNTVFGYQAGCGSLAPDVTAVGAGAALGNICSSATVMGCGAGMNNKGISQTAMGLQAGQSNSGSTQTAIGSGAGACNKCCNQTAIGGNAGACNRGINQTVIGANAGCFNSGSTTIGIGVCATRLNKGNDVVAIGFEAGASNLTNCQFIIKQNNVCSCSLIQGNFVTGEVHLRQNAWQYFGNSGETNSWRLGVSGATFVHQCWGGSAYVTKQSL